MFSQPLKQSDVVDRFVCAVVPGAHQLTLVQLAGSATMRAPARLVARSPQAAAALLFLAMARPILASRAGGKPLKSGTPQGQSGCSSARPGLCGTVRSKQELRSCRWFKVCSLIKQYWDLWQQETAASTSVLGNKRQDFVGHPDDDDDHHHHNYHNHHNHHPHHSHHYHHPHHPHPHPHHHHHHDHHHHDHDHDHDNDHQHHQHQQHQQQQHQHHHNQHARRDRHCHQHANRNEIMTLKGQESHSAKAGWLCG